MTTEESDEHGRCPACGTSRTLSEVVQPSLPYGLGTRWLTMEQVCAWFQMPERTIYGMVQRQSIPFRKIGQALRFPEAELEEWSRPKPKPGAGRMIPLRVTAPAPRPRAKPGSRRLSVTYD